MVQRWYQVHNTANFIDLPTDTLIDPYLSLVIAIMTAAGWSR